NLTTIAGCDSIITTNLIVNPIISITSYASICEGDSYILPDGTSVDVAGIYYSTIGTYLGCDTIIITELTVNSTYLVSVDTAICEGDIYILPDGTATALAGSHYSNFITASGCDSIIITNLTVNAAPTISQTVNMCEGSSYILPDGVIVDAPGTYSSVISTGLGCDSTI
ncbi:MAG: hypothetical protein ACK4IY_09690, partial [Chitinophagales bacterium]